MNSKERMMIALNQGKPDRAPATIHQWQPYHLENYMNGKSDIEAFEEIGLDAAITYCPFEEVFTDKWKVTHKEVKCDGYVQKQYRVETPDGFLTYSTGTNEYTTWIMEHIIKNDEDIYLYKKYYPEYTLNKKALSEYYDKLGDGGIMRTFLPGYQGGCWQDACELYGTENMIFAAIDKPDWVHEFLSILLERKLKFIYENLKDAKIDLVETGGGASSSTVISPAMHKEFCLPYDYKMHKALHDMGHKAVYHTCGGMMGILDLITENGCDASETLSPPGVGGNITEPEKVKAAMQGKVALIGGLDQINILTEGTPEEVQNEVVSLFKAYGEGGGYIMSACDHFFHAPYENLKAYAQAASKCIY